MKQKNILTSPLQLSFRVLLLVPAVLILWHGTLQQASAQLTTADCLACHTVANWSPYASASEAHHAKIEQFDCLYCHVTFTDPVHDNCTLCHSSAGHQADHDKTILPSSECQECHLDNVFDEHYVRRSIDCAVCHDNPDPNVQAVIAAGRGLTGTAQECGACHIDVGQHEADHDMTRINEPGCLNPTGGCHYSENVFTEHVVERGWQCSACHGSTDKLVTDAIAKGKGNPPDTQPMEVLCTDCHGLDVLTHEAAHDHTFLPTVSGQNCTLCHSANVVTEHVLNRDFTCATCHASTRPEVWQAIEDGRTKDGTVSTDIYCIRCHEQSGQGEGHPLVTVEPWSECILCHNSITYNSNPLLVFHDEHIAYAEDLNLGCAACHAKAPAVPNCEACHQLDSTSWGTLPRGSSNLNIIGPNSEDHDKHTRIIHCATCHVTSVPGGTPIPPPFNDCDTCHETLRYGQPGHNTHISTANENCSTCHTAAPDCGQCHAPGHQAVPAPFNGCDTCHETLQPGQVTHNEHRTAAQDNCAACHTDQPDCGQCHAPGHPPVPTPYDSCDQCHTTLQPGQATHDLHRTAAQQNCALCHTAAPNCGECHSAGHPTIPPPYDSCDQCHTTLQPGQATHIAHRTAASDNCTTCHTAAPNCASCHGNTHHTTDQAKSGECTHCHADPRLDVDPNAPVGQLACRQCHVDGNGFVKTGTGAPSHAFNTAGAIKDFGACFDCHQPTPYHAKPINRPRDCFATMDTAPGKGSFNIFSSQFGGGGEHNERNERCDDYESRYRNPAVQFSWANITDTLGTNKQWTVPTFGTGISTGGDTVKITLASYDRERRRITVYAENTLGSKATLKANYRGTSYSMSWNSYRNRWQATIYTSYCNYTVEVVSSAGGSATSSISNCSR